MRNNVRWQVLLAAALTGLWATVGLAAEGQQAPAGLDHEAMEKMMIEAAKPGPEHELFQRAAGKWKTQCTAYCEDPQNPKVSEGTAVFKLLLDGRFLEQHFHGSFDGKPFEGMGLCGYDNVQKKYVGIWTDTMSSGIMHTEGQFDKANDTMTETGEAATPMGPMHFKMVTKPVDENKFTFTMYMLMPGGSETKSMEIVYTRQE